MSKPTVNIIEAKIVDEGTVPYMWGYVLNHPNLPAGAYVKTSPVILTLGNKVETRNTIYNVVWKKGYEQNSDDQIR